MQTDTTPRANFPVPLAARIERQLTRLERDVAILMAWQEFLALGRRHDA
jgi:hypothetical protein